MIRVTLSDHRPPEERLLTFDFDFSAALPDAPGEVARLTVRVRHPAAKCRPALLADLARKELVPLLRQGVMIRRDLKLPEKVAAVQAGMEMIEALDLAGFFAAIPA